MNTIPDGWTDDMSIQLPPGRTVDEITNFVLESALSKVTGEGLVRAIECTFGLSTEDAELVCDRVFGGVVRAGTRNVANRPNPVKDPFAYSSYQRANREPSIFATLYPNRAGKRKRLWWQFWR